MEKLASRKLRIGAKQTMQLAESLYTRGFISYPRTETNIFPSELKLAPLVEAQTQDSRWAGLLLSSSSSVSVNDYFFPSHLNDPPSTVTRSRPPIRSQLSLSLSSHSKPLIIGR